MKEFIIENCTAEEIDKLYQASDIDWYPDNIESRDVCIYGTHNDVDKALKLIGRKSRMKGYRVFFDKEKMIFRHDIVKSEAEATTSDGTTSWIDDNLEAVNGIVREMNNKSLDEVKMCKDCGEPYWLTKDRKQWFEDMGLKPPVRCQSCINKRKHKNNSKKGA